VKVRRRGSTSVAHHRAMLSDGARAPSIETPEFGDERKNRE
jgi:hypothetical protein